MFSKKSFFIASTNARSAVMAWLRLSYENELAKSSCVRYAFADYPEYSKITEISYVSEVDTKLISILKTILWFRLKVDSLS